VIPKIEWTNLPDAIQKHLLLRLNERDWVEASLEICEIKRDQAREQ
jgi:hypothetical protein